MTTAPELLLQTARKGELHHAVILHGGASQPLRDLAIAIARTLNCVQRTAGDHCPACDRISRRLFPDVHHVEVGGDRKMIAVEQIRELVLAAAFRPYEGRNKVFIIDPADALSAGGSNALLKTLEEPARDTHFILITRSPDLLLPTIRSRCQSIYVAGEDEIDLQLRAELASMLGRFAGQHETAMLLTVAARVAGADDVKEAMVLLASLMRDAAAGTDAALESLTAALPRERLLESASAMMTAVEALRVNADPRLLTEKGLAVLIGA